jgi:hypothetical protein
VAARLPPLTADERALGVTLWLGARSDNYERKAA